MFKSNTPKSHPRYLSLYYRDLLSYGVEKGITSLQGLTAHGRGETFDYLIGEKTRPFARKSIKTAAALLLLAKRPVISVNGNTAILIPKELINLAEIIPAKLEINVFHHSKQRERNIAAYLKRLGAKEVLLPDGGIIPGIESNRRITNAKGQQTADVVFVPLEDGDRTACLISLGKKVITCDLNPLSRTAKKATVTIVDNIVRALPRILKEIKIMKNNTREELEERVKYYNNKAVLNKSLIFISERLKQLAV